MERFAIAPDGTTPLCNHTHSLYIRPMKARDMACLLLVSLAVLMAVLLVSCRRADSSIPTSENELPDMELHDADYTLGKDLAFSSPDDPVVMHAGMITIYSTGRDTVLTEVSFRQGDKMEGSCRSASVSSDNNSATLTGDVTIRLDNDGTLVTITSQEVVWNGEDNSLLCTGEVLVTYGDGTVIHAEGFSASMDDNRYEFGRILEGKLE